jgi:hypothetical protein
VANYGAFFAGFHLFRMADDALQGWAAGGPWSSVSLTDTIGLWTYLTLPLAVLVWGVAYLAVPRPERAGALAPPAR